MNFYIFFLIKTSNHADVIIFRNEKYFVAKKNGRINSYSRNEKEWLLEIFYLATRFLLEKGPKNGLSLSGLCHVASHAITRQPPSTIKVPF